MSTKIDSIANVMDDVMDMGRHSRQKILAELTGATVEVIIGKENALKKAKKLDNFGSAMGVILGNSKVLF